VKKRLTIAVVAIAIALLGAMGVALASAGAGTHSGRLPVAYNGVDGWQHGVARLPVLYIGESTVFVKTPHWSRWSASSASTRGTLWVDSCTPNCAAGKYRRYPATVRLSGVAKHNGVSYFSQMKLSYDHGYQRTYTYSWGVLPGASIPGWNGGPRA
jgi:hypothetical protein